MGRRNEVVGVKPSRYGVTWSSVLICPACTMFTVTGKSGEKERDNISYLGPSRPIVHIHTMGEETLVCGATDRRDLHPPRRSGPRHNHQFPGSRSRPVAAQFVNQCGDWLRHEVIRHGFQRLQPLLFHNRIRASTHTGLVGAARPRCPQGPNSKHERARHRGMLGLSR